MSVEAKTSCTTTCASETDDGDYETSSEGPVRKEVAQNSTNKEAFSASSSKMGSQQDNDTEDSESKKKKSSEKFFKDTRVVSSESPLARRRKMKMIVAQIFSRSSITSTTLSGGSRTELTKENYQAKKMESRTMLPVLQGIDYDPPNRLKEVTFHELPEDKDFSSDRSQTSERKKTKSSRLPTRDDESQQHSQENGDLIDIAENPHPSIKSFYFPPNPQKEASSASLRTHSRATKDGVQRDVSELRFLLQQLNVISGRARALSQIDPFLSSQRHSTQCSPYSNISGYYLHQTETYSRDTQVNDSIQLISRQMIDESSQGIRDTDYVGSRAFCPAGNQMVPLGRDYTHYENPMKHSSRYVGRNLSSGLTNRTVGEDDSRVTLNNFHFQFGQYVEKHPSGSLIPSVSSSCYRCHRNRTCVLSHYDDTAGCSTSSGGGQVTSAFSKRADENLYKSRDLVEKSTMKSKEFPLDLSDNQPKPSWASLMNSSSKVRTTCVNAELLADEKPRSHKNSAKNSNNSLHCYQDQSVAASLIRIASDLSRPSTVKCLNSQASLVISKRDQDVMVSNLGLVEDQTTSCSSQVVTKHEHPKGQKKKSVKDLDVQCSGSNLKFHQKEIALGQSMESFLKPSVSEESNASKGSSNQSKSIQVATEEKVVVVPIVFTDGVPEPQKIPLFTVTRSRTHLHNVKCHLVKLKKGTSALTQSSMVSANSIESCETSLNRDDSKSKMSVSCVSRSSLHCRNGSRTANTIKTLSDHRHRSDSKHKRVGSMASGYTQSTKAHSEPTKKRVMYGMRSSPEDFVFDT
ncbi:uncharacterized protein LOC117606509 isoform X2 [Osmia lignaria lignaria]|uniref:uncharacterized protein LOC117606509 isoform X2 n=1 Tax=Osmia lignaria lignaria TaxID=1437193 RepID=UPI0014797F9E|nr:uncharacterized protein LOC117606509 isoform X2 [Osmia lignaria]